MHSSVLAGAVAVPGHMSASGSRGLIHRHSGVVTVARPTDKISCFPPPLAWIRTVSAHADPLAAEPPLRCMACAVICTLRRHADKLWRSGRAATGLRLRLLEPELAAVAPHRVHDHRELACHRHAGALVTAPLGNLQPPRIEAAEAAVARQHAVGGLVERMPHIAVTGPGDVRLNIDRRAGLRDLSPRYARTVFEWRNRCGSSINVL